MSIHATLTVAPGDVPKSPPAAASLRERIQRAQAEIREEYLTTDHAHPWIIGFSGGKDSTLLLQLVLETLLAIAPADRRRDVHVLTNDTLVESPIFMAHVNKALLRISSSVEALNLPVRVVRTTPVLDHTFWVNLIGRGYPAPNRMFRWCTDRMKIRPTSNYILSQVAASGQAILLLGVRRSESAVRAASVDKYTPANGARLNPHNDLKGTLVFRPIVDFSTEEVWQFLFQRPPPWGGSHRDLVTLYRNSQDGECPLVVDAETAPSCGSSSLRFGCWTCTVVEKDRSMESYIDAGYTHLEPLFFFREWLAAIRNDRSRRLRERRNGLVTLMKDGSLVPGPFTLEARKEILERLLATQSEVELPLISDEEIAFIKAIWAQDAADEALRLATTVTNARRKR
jgi:DNA sulfur modification protein DndC